MASNFPIARITRRTSLMGGAAVSLMIFASSARAGGRGGPIEIYAAPRRLVGVEHKVVYRKDDEFAGWPHVMGYWNMGDGEILQQIRSTTTTYPNAQAIAHNKLGSQGGVTKMLSFRSKDYGRTWTGPENNIFGRIDKSMANAKNLGDLQPIDYLDENVLIANNATAFAAPTSKTNVRVSKDRGHTWSPPFEVPLDGLHSASGMNSVLIRPDGTALIWLIEVINGFDRHPCVFALPPRGLDFHFLSFVTPKVDTFGNTAGDWKPPLAFAGQHWFYPRGYLLPNGRMLCVLRSQRGPEGVMWTEVYKSDDGGRTWSFLSRVNDFGAPGSLVVKKDGRLVMVYGYRLMPSGIRAKVSEDDGATWGPELIVRDDGGSWDLGYPNAWEMDDGRICTIYYFNSKDDKIQVNGGVRHVQRSIFSID
ncbi:sialidase family protein [Croceibacterium aestuarii]|uniref:sialidase family protein n=1 Tax=Croceibacterium aestuarii TaxID=3064139 RepID=UPI00272E9816|nr:sialidase family protein [Croceibacterium sp. D39]